MITILIAENIPALNKGELALLKGMMESFNSLGEFKIKIMSTSPENDRIRYGDKVELIDVRKGFNLKEGFKYPLNKKITISLSITIKHFIFLILYKIIGEKVTKVMKSKIWSEYLNSDVILIGHNGIFGIGNGLIGNYFNFLTSLSYLYLPFFGKIVQKPLVIYASSIYPYKSFITRKWMSFLLNRIDLITLRETQSLKNLLSLNYSANKAYVTADLAFLMNPESEDVIKKIMKSEGIPEESNLIGITVTRHMAITAYKGLGLSKSYNEHSKMIANVLDYLIENKNAKIIFLPHSIGFEVEYDDRIISEYIFNLCKNKERITIIKKEYSPEELKGLMKEFNLFIGERLHSVIGAMSVKTPSVVISNMSDQRLEIIRDLGQENSICYVENLKEEDLITKIDEIWEKKNEIKNDLHNQIEDVIEKSMENGKFLHNLVIK